MDSRVWEAFLDVLMDGLSDTGYHVTGKEIKRISDNDPFGYSVVERLLPRAFESLGEDQTDADRQGALRYIMDNTIKLKDNLQAKIVRYKESEAYRMKKKSKPAKPEVVKPSKEEIDVLRGAAYMRVRDHLIGKVFVQKIQSSAVVSFKLTDGGFEHWHANPDISRTPVYNSFMLTLNMYYSESLSWKLAVEKILRDSAEQYKAAKTPVPTFRGLVADVVNSILQGEEKEAEIEEDAPLLAWDDDATVRLDSSKLVDGPTPHFDSFLQRVDFPEVLMAFVWKIFDASDCKGRQMLWGVSEGNAGQSTFWSAIKEPLADITVSMQSITNLNQFSESKFYRKRLAIMADCKSRHFHNTGLVKKVSGSDTADVERKGQDSFTADIWSRIVIHSNMFPEIDTTDNSIMTRMLVITVGSIPDGEENLHIIEEYRKEIWSFLYKCREVEARVCGGKAQIPMPPEMYKSILGNCEDPIRLAIRKYCKNRVSTKFGSTIKENLLWEDLFGYIKKELRIKSGYGQEIERKRAELLKSFLKCTRDAHPDIKKVLSEGGLNQAYDNIFITGFGDPDYTDEVEDSIVADAIAASVTSEDEDEDLDI